MEYNKMMMQEEISACSVRKSMLSRIVVPTRDGMFKPSDVSPSPMTDQLAASFLVDQDPDTINTAAADDDPDLDNDNDDGDGDDQQLRSFTSLMNPDHDQPESPTSFSAALFNKEMIKGDGFGQRLAARGSNTNSFVFDSVSFFDQDDDQDVKPVVDHMKLMMQPPSALPINRSNSCLTIPPGISPTTLFDSSVLFSNYQAGPSPTTGTYSSFPAGFSGENGVQMSPQCSESSKESDIEKEASSGFVFKPLTKQASLPPCCDLPMKLGTSHPQFLPQYEQPGISHSLGTRLPSSITATSSSTMLSSAPSFDPKTGLNTELQKADFGALLPASEDILPPVAEHVPMVERPSEDGYNWRKYGQKQVKGSEFPRSYYKCTNTNCPVKKKVERSHDGQVTEIVYKGEHNHSRPLPGRRLHSSASLQDVKEERTYLENAGKVSHGLNNRDNFTLERAPSGSLVDPGENPSTPSYSDDDDQGSRLSIQDGDEDGPDSKRRRMENLTAEMDGVQRTIREPRVVVQTTSEIDILDDGYRWRKYGQKVVKGNPHPRSYYKCTNVGCLVRKHVERASDDPKSVITTYEGKHNHDVPAAKANIHENCTGEASSLLAQTAAFTPCIDSLTSAPSRQDHTSSFPGKSSALVKFPEHDLKGTSMNMSATESRIQLGINRATVYGDTSIKFPKQEALSFPTSTFMDFSEAFPSSAEDWKGTFHAQDHTHRLKQEEDNYLQPFVDSSSSILDHSLPPRLVPTP